MSGTHVVAITRLATAVEVEAKALAVNLGGVAYEQRLKLVAGVPAVVLATPDERRATAVLAAVTARGHGALHVRDSDVVASADMLALRRPQLETGALVSAGGPGPVRLRWSDIAALVRATQRVTVETRTEVKESKFDVTRAALTGGIVTSKSTTRTAVSRADEVEGVLYIFPRTGGVPWLLREQHAWFDALGAAVTPTSTRNFALLVDELRTRAPGAVFDERLVARKGAPAEVDLLAHIVALAVAGGGSASPFR